MIFESIHMKKILILFLVNFAFIGMRNAFSDGCCGTHVTDDESCCFKSFKRVRDNSGANVDYEDFRWGYFESRYDKCYVVDVNLCTCPCNAPYVERLTVDTCKTTRVTEIVEVENFLQTLAREIFGLTIEELELQAGPVTTKLKPTNSYKKVETIKKLMERAYEIKPTLCSCNKAIIEALKKLLEKERNIISSANYPPEVEKNTKTN